ncbi:Hydroxymethylpyrimidine phosphate kinase ThiD [Streptococcus sp. DD10]|uniref:bifunctional hydroxymethylpyrimidine kinase/phosphomethylpyrimidine kinase n=1 Tax=Streptococcus sp. DD10 TaxID=1777878 RepID=UPI0007926F70|nr:bifunctional hydroxymethylpyrimidine kinase/phosphomethylpyrimidine kinase [Streptococcus sp. DD10]KXT72464.1 Hydroxymethylpyrimidine phosphate kinase ThiD [Streptococcus sp. DD10]
MSNDFILAISGNDIFSGGGLHADLATYTTNKQHGFVAVTCLTAMTEKGFEVIPIEQNIFAQQLDSLKDVPFAGIKLGLLPNVEIAELALDFVKTHTAIPVVLDPVLVCKESHDVEVSALRTELIKFFPYVSVITPNLPEAELLTQISIKTIEDMQIAAQKLYDLGAKHVVVKGGNRLDQEKAIDVVYDGNEFTILEGELLEKNNTGAGCTFASSIASQLVVGKNVLDAVRISKDFVFHAIQKSDQYGVVQYDN